MATRSRSFKEEHPLGRLFLPRKLAGSLQGAVLSSDACAEKRQAEAARIRDKYPDRIPVSFMDLHSRKD